MATLTAFAPAKVNLALHVLGRRDDGYHLLDSLVVFADVGDVLHAVPAASLDLHIAGPFAAFHQPNAGEVISVSCIVPSIMQ